MVFEDLDAALLSVWGSSASDVWVVGSDAGDGPIVLHFDGTEWRQLDTGAEGALWWVSGDGRGSIWMAGDAGLVLRYDIGADTFERMETPSDAQVFGIYPVGLDEVWAVGGDGATGAGVAWRYDGATWSVVDDVPADAAAEGAFFKVWSPGPDEVWIVGLGGVALHRHDHTWTVLDVPLPRPLFTIHGNGADALAVGGFLSGMAVRVTNDGLEDVTAPGMPQLNGVWVRPDGTATAVGVQGAVWSWDGTSWAAVSGVPRTSLDFHSVYADPDGGVWAVGGFVVSDPLHGGMLAHLGPPVPTEFIDP